jgi:hypothetical protein
VSDTPDLYPEHTKLRAISDQSQACMDFIEWLGEEYEIVLCEIPEDYERTYFPIMRSLTKLLAEHFDIDLDKIETEKRAMLAAMREANDG